MTDEREEAWGRLHEALPARWTVGQPSYDPGAREWSISAVGLNRGRGRIPTSVTGRGGAELDAVRNLDARLRGELPDGPHNIDALRVRLRLAYLAGAEEWSLKEARRSLTDAELAGVVARYLGR